MPWQSPRRRSSPLAAPRAALSWLRLDHDVQPAARWQVFIQVGAAEGAGSEVCVLGHLRGLPGRASEMLPPQREETRGTFGR
jgi:hypothetical protein